MKESRPKSPAKGRGRPRKSVERDASPKSGKKSDQNEIDLEELYEDSRDKTKKAKKAPAKSNSRS